MRHFHIRPSSPERAVGTPPMPRRSRLLRRCLGWLGAVHRPGQQSSSWLLGEVGDEGVQSERIGRQCQQGLHHRSGLVTQIIPALDCEPRRLDGCPQFVGRGQVTDLRSVGPWQWIFRFATLANGDVPQGQSTTAKTTTAGSTNDSAIRRRTDYLMRCARLAIRETHPNTGDGPAEDAAGVDRTCRGGASARTRSA
jgi:hypothetical protein